MKEVAPKPVWKPVKQPPRAVERRARGTLLATRLFMAGRATPSPSPTIPRASITAGRVHPAAATCQSITSYPLLPSTQGETKIMSVQPNLSLSFLVCLTLTTRTEAANSALHESSLTTLHSLSHTHATLHWACENRRGWLAAA